MTEIVPNSTKSSDSIIVDLDGVVFVVDDEGDISYEDPEYAWLQNTDIWSDAYQIEIDNIDSVADNVIQFIEPHLPITKGRYKVYGKLQLVYDITGVYKEMTDMWDEGERGMDYDEEIYTDNAISEFNWEASKLSNFNFESI